MLRMRCYYQPKATWVRTTVVVEVQQLTWLLCLLVILFYKLRPDTTKRVRHEVEVEVDAGDRSFNLTFQVSE
jgi:hypothetical protein